MSTSALAITQQNAAEEILSENGFSIAVEINHETTTIQTRGIFAHHATKFDAETGQQVTAESISVAFVIEKLIEGGIELEMIVGSKVILVDVGSFRIIDSRPDKTLTIVVAFLESIE